MDDAFVAMTEGGVKSPGALEGDKVAEKSSIEPKKPTEPAIIEGIDSSTDTRVTSSPWSGSYSEVASSYDNL
jgi:hypothetical protein